MGQLRAGRVLCAPTPSLPCGEDQEPHDESERTDPEESPEPEQCEKDQGRCAGKAPFSQGTKDVTIDGCIDVGREPPHPPADRESSKSSQRNAEERAIVFLATAECHAIIVIAHPGDHDEPAHANRRLLRDRE